MKDELGKSMRPELRTQLSNERGKFLYVWLKKRLGNVVWDRLAYGLWSVVNDAVGSQRDKTGSAVYDRRFG